MMKKNKRHALLSITTLVACAALVFFITREDSDSRLPQSLPDHKQQVTQPSKPTAQLITPAPQQKDHVAEVPVLELAEPENEQEMLAVAEEPPQNDNKILCEHIVSGETRDEFTGQIRLINKGYEPVYGWSVEWEYPDGSVLFSSADVALAGNNPYTGEYLDSNAEIAPGKTVTFSFTGIKGGETAPKNVNVSGDFCM